MSNDERIFRVRVPASTSNLGSGFDVLGLGLGMYLELSLEPGTGSIEVLSTGEGADKLPTDESNLIAQLILEHAPSLRDGGFRVRTHSEIPLTRGFGSSASAIVGALALAQLATIGRIDRDAILQISTALEGHPDNVSASIFGGLTISAALETGVVTQTLRLPSAIQIVALTPDREVSTSAARAALPPAYERPDVVFNLQRLSQLIAGLYQGDLALIGSGLHDKLHQRYRCGLLPPMDRALAAMQEMPGSIGAFVSGAGPALVAFVTENAEAIGQAAVAIFEAEGIEASARVIGPDDQGVIEM